MHRLLLFALVSVVTSGAGWAQETPARELFGAVDAPAATSSQSIGGYSRGCLAGAAALPTDGPNWQAMRLERNRYWGHPSLVAYLERLAVDAAEADGWPGLLIGDMSQPRGGPMLGGHVSHQTGLDVDLWYMPMPERQLTSAERSDLGANSLLIPGTLEVDPALWSDDLFRLLRRAASYPEVARIFVHPGIKLLLCESAGADRDWLRVIRPWYGHADHFHVRLDCPPGEAGCAPQAAPPEGDGCGAELDYWLGPEPWLPVDRPPSPPLTLADLPAACSAVVNDGQPPPPLPPARPG